MGIYCCKSEDKEEQQIANCENEYKPIPCACNNNCNEICKTRPPCMYGYKCPCPCHYGGKCAFKYSLH